MVVIFVFTSLAMFISTFYNYNIDHITLEKNTHISKFQFKKLSFCSLDVLGTFSDKKSRILKWNFFKHKFTTRVRVL